MTKERVSLRPTAAARERELPQDRPGGGSLVGLLPDAAEPEPSRLEGQADALEVATDQVGHDVEDVRRATVHEDVDGGVGVGRRARDDSLRHDARRSGEPDGRDGPFGQPLTGEGERRRSGRQAGEVGGPDDLGPQGEEDAKVLPGLDRHSGSRALPADPVERGSPRRRPPATASTTTRRPRSAARAVASSTDRPVRSGTSSALPRTNRENEIHAATPRIPARRRA